MEQRTTGEQEQRQGNGSFGSSSSSTVRVTNNIRGTTSGGLRHVANVSQAQGMFSFFLHTLLLIVIFNSTQHKGIEMGTSAINVASTTTYYASNHQNEDGNVVSGWSPGTIKHHLHDVSNCHQMKDHNERRPRLRLEVKERTGSRRVRV